MYSVHSEGDDFVLHPARVSTREEAKSPRSAPWIVESSVKEVADGPDVGPPGVEVEFGKDGEEPALTRRLVLLEHLFFHGEAEVVLDLHADCGAERQPRTRVQL
jgi:hypothetical protein